MRSEREKRDADGLRLLSVRLASELSLFGLFHLKVVLYREDTKHAIRTQEGIILISLRSHHAFQIYMAVFHNNVNGRHWLVGIIRESRITEDCSRHLVAYAVIVE